MTLSPTAKVFYMSMKIEIFWGFVEENGLNQDSRANHQSSPGGPGRMAFVQMVLFLSFTAFRQPRQPKLMRLLSSQENSLPPKKIICYTECQSNKKPVEVADSTYFSAETATPLLFFLKNKKESLKENQFFIHPLFTAQDWP